MAEPYLYYNLIRPGKLIAGFGNVGYRETDLANLQSRAQTSSPKAPEFYNHAPRDFSIFLE